MSLVTAKGNKSVETFRFLRFPFYCFYCYRAQLPRHPINVGMKNSDPGENYNIERGSGRRMELHLKPRVFINSKFVIWQDEVLEPPQQFLSLIVAWKLSTSSKKVILGCTWPFVTFPDLRVLSKTSAPGTRLICVSLLTSLANRPPAVSLANRSH